MSPGRPRGVEAQLRALLRDDWDAMHLAMSDIVLGRLPPGLSSESTVKIKDRIEAYKVLNERAFGKARMLVDHTTSDPEPHLDIDVESLDVDELVRLERLLDEFAQGTKK